VSLARSTLGFEPRVSLTEGLRLTLARDPRFRQRV
jgi:nucleoside-diphosphate-sugar epimerase